MALDDDVRTLARLPLFQQIEQEALRLIAFSAETKILRSGDTLFRKGEPADSGYLVVSGSFRVVPERRGEAETVIPAHCLIGETALLTATERPATVMAREPASVLKIPRTLFHRVLREHPTSALRVRAIVEERLLAFTRGLAAGQAAVLRD